MEKTTILKASDYMYNGYDFERPLNTIDLNNLKLIGNIPVIVYSQPNKMISDN